MSSGDLFGLLVPAHTQLPIPRKTSAAAAASSSAHLQQYDVVYFQISKVFPESPAPLAVDPSETELVLKGGSARVLLPVGYKGYAVAAAAAAYSPAAADKDGNSQHNAQTADGHTPGSKSPPAAAGLPADSPPGKPQQQQQQQLPLLPLVGVHASAAYQSAVGYPGVPGPLTDTWRHVAHVIAPLLHPAAQVCLVASASTAQGLGCAATLVG